MNTWAKHSKNPFMTLTLHERLQREASRRIQYGVAFQLAAYLFLFFSYGFEPDQTTSFIVLNIAGFALVAFRGLAVLLLSKKIAFKKLYHFQMSMTLLTALTNSLLAGCTIAHYRIFNSQIILILFYVIAMSTAVISSLAPARPYQRLYFACASIPLIISFFNPDLNDVFHNLGAVCTLYFAYLVYCGHIISKDLLNSYQAELSAHQQKETLQKVIDLVPGFVALSDPQGNWTTTSQSFEKFRFSSAFLEICKQFRLGHITQYTREVTWYENGEKNSFILSTQKFADLSIIVVGMPAEEIFEMRKELDTQRTKAEFSARLATLGEMAGGIAHEINNPLAVIIGVSSQISASLKQPSPDLVKLSERIDKISKTSFRISKIIAGLQSFSRQSDKDAFVPTKVSQIVEDTLELCREKFYQNSVQLNVHELVDVEVPVRSVQISQVLINLLNNAFDAVKKLSQPTIDLTFQETETEVFINVSDSGPGIPKANLERIFDPFFTTKDVGQGTGLGLSISRGIMLDHQGEITYLPNEGRTTFRLRLPKMRKK